MYVECNKVTDGDKISIDTIEDVMLQAGDNLIKKIIKLLNLFLNGSFRIQFICI